MLNNYLKELVTDHYKQFGSLPKLHSFKFEEPFQTALKMPPKDALEWLKKRGSKQSTADEFQNILNDFGDEAHNKAFTVANIYKADVLQEIYNYVEQARAEGWTVDKFKNEVANGGLMNRMKEAGWTGKTPNRLKVIYDTNIAMAAANGKIKRIKMLEAILPYLVYRQVERKTKRHDHAQFHNRKFRVDDPIWNIIMPPSAFGCDCDVVQVKEADGVESGDKYIDQAKASKEFVLQPAKQFTPDTTKYVDKLKTQIDAALANNPHPLPQANVPQQNTPTTQPISTFNALRNSLPDLPSCSESEFNSSWGNDINFANEVLGTLYMTKEQFLSLFVPTGAKLTRSVGSSEVDDYHFYGDNFAFHNDTHIIRRDFHMRDSYVDHSFYKIIDPNNRGAGLTKEAFLKQLSLYYAQGLDRIDIHADIDVGCWSWGRYGFRFIDFYNGHDIAYLLDYDFGISVEDYEIDDCFIQDDLMMDCFERFKDLTGLDYQEIKDFFVNHNIDWNGYFDLYDEDCLGTAVRYCRGLI